MQNAPYGVASQYLKIPAGPHNVKVYATGDDSAPVIEADAEVAGGASYAIGAVGLVSDGSLTARVYEDDIYSPEADNAKGGVVRASPDAGSVDVVPKIGEPLFSGLKFPSLSGYAEVPADSYVPNVNAAGTDQAAITAESTVVDGVHAIFTVGTEPRRDPLTPCRIRAVRPRRGSRARRGS